MAEKVLTAKFGKEERREGREEKQSQNILLRPPRRFSAIFVLKGSLAGKLDPPLLDAQLFSGVGAEAFGRPGRSPYNINGAIADAGQLLDAGFNLSADVYMLGAALRGEGHFDGYVLLGVVCTMSGGGGKVHFVDQAKIDDIDRNLGIVAALQSTQHILFSDSGHCKITSLPVYLIAAARGAGAGSGWKLGTVFP
jgi:hypothetical protein